MHPARQSKKQWIHFSRWSRKAYSLFSCLGKEVVISALKCRLADMGMMAKKADFVLFFEHDGFGEERLENPSGDVSGSRQKQSESRCPFVFISSYKASDYYVDLIVENECKAAGA